jgi:hypothetical protein
MSIESWKMPIVAPRRRPSTCRQIFVGEVAAAADDRRASGGSTLGLSPLRLRISANHLPLPGMLAFSSANQFETMFN